MKYEFITHTLFTDGKALPTEMIRNHFTRRGKVIAITDHATISSWHYMVYVAKLECALAERHWNVVAIPGVEITHVPPRAIRKIAKDSKEHGVELVIVHGETINESIAPETNLRALQCPEVDVLAHPGLLTPEEAELAAKNDIFIALSGREGHCLTNGHIVKVGSEAGVKFLITSEAHQPSELLTTNIARKIGRGAGLSKRGVDKALSENPKKLLKRIGRHVV